MKNLWSSFWNLTDKFLEFATLNLAFTMGTMFALIGIISTNIYAITLAILHFSLHTMREIKRLSNSDSPTPQNWVYFQVIVRGDGYDYSDFVIVQDLADHVNQIKAYYAKKNHEVIDIFTCYISARI